MHNTAVGGQFTILQPMGHDCRRVYSHRRHDETVANYLRIRVHSTADATRLDSFVSSALAVCIGLNELRFRHKSRRVHKKV